MSNAAASTHTPTNTTRITGECFQWWMFSHQTFLVKLHLKTGMTPCVERLTWPWWRWLPGAWPIRAACCPLDFTAGLLGCLFCDRHPTKVNDSFGDSGWRIPPKYQAANHLRLGLQVVIIPFVPASNLFFKVEYRCVGIEFGWFLGCFKGPFANSESQNQHLCFLWRSDLV